MALTERLQDTRDVGYWTGEIPLNYVYTYGRAGEVFFRNLKDKGTLLGARCEACDITYAPPRIYCENCFARLENSYVELGTSGTVHTFTVLHKNLDGSAKVTPVIMAMVRLDGSDGGVVHYLGEVDASEVQFGMKVEAVLKPENERKGAITDIEYFRPSE